MGRVDSKMKNYNAKVYSNDKRFNDMPISLRSDVAVHPNTRLNWIEDIDEDADTAEKLWYERVVKNNIVKGK